MKAPVPTVTVHANGLVGKPTEAFELEMFAHLHSSDDAGEGEELLVFAAQQRISLEEGNYLLQEISAPADDEDECPVVRAPVVLPDRSTADMPSDQVEDLCTTDVLAYPELRHELPTNSCARVPLDRYVKAAFSIDEARDVRIQPFLLIGRTCRIITAPAFHGPERTFRV